MSGRPVPMVRTLPNGLTAAVLPVHAAPVVALQVWVKVGAADEQADEAGLAHLHEHMLFKGTARRGTGEIAREIESRGGEVNAWTSHDQTVYHVVLASRFLSEGLDVLSDAIRSSAFDPDELARETRVVVEEIKRSEDSPSRRLSRELFATAYAAHPYRLPVIGTVDSVLGFTRPKIVDFYRRHYTPSNAVVVAVGDLSTDRGFAEIERWFGGWAGDAPPHIRRAAEATQDAVRVRLVPSDFRDTRFALGFHIPELTHPDVPAIDLLALLIGQGESSHFQRTLKRQAGLFQEVHAYGYTPKDAGLFVVGGTPTRGRGREAIDSLLLELSRVRSGEVPLGGEELAKAKHQIESDQIYQRETVQGLARKVGFYQTVTGSLEAEADYLARVAAATTEDLLSVAERYLNATQATLVALQGSDSVDLKESDLRERIAQLLPVRRSHPLGVKTFVPRPKPLAPKPSEASSEPLRVFRHASGARILVKREADVPVVAMRAAFLGGVRGETAADNGITALLGRTLTRGAAGKSADRIAQTVDEIAGSLGAVPGRNSFGLRAETLAPHVETAVGLVADCLLEPDFPSGDVERERGQQLQEIRAREDNPSGVCIELFHRTLFTAHPYRFAASGEIRSVEPLTREALEQHWKARYPLSALTLAVVGDVDPEAVFGLLTARLAKAKPQAPSVLSLDAERRPIGPRAARVELAKEQTHLMVGFLGTTLSDPVRFSLAVLSSALSGQGGRLFLELRDKQSLAYSVTSFTMDGLEPGYFAVYIGTSPEKRDQALTAIRSELTKVCEAPLSAEELDRAQQSLIGSHAIGLQRRAAVAGTIALDELYGLGAEAYLSYADRISAVTSEQVLNAARRFLDPSGEVVAEVGPKA